jgi:hypothetical protein
MKKQLMVATEAGNLYATAYAAHYGSRETLRALELYMALIAGHPLAPEAGFARTQVENIIHDVVPADDLLAVEIALVVGRLEPPSPRHRWISPSA